MKMVEPFFLKMQVLLLEMKHFSGNLTCFFQWNYLLEIASGYIIRAD